MRVGALAQRHGVTLNWQPFFLPPVRDQQSMGFPFPDESAKTAYMWTDLERRARRHGLPYRKPDTYPVNSLQTIRTALVGAREGWCQAFTEEAFRLHWTEGVLIGTEDNLLRALRNAGQEPARVVPLASSPDNKEALKAQTPRAIARGIFGSPSFVVAGELFWGDDRLEQALNWPPRAAPSVR